MRKQWFPTSLALLVLSAASVPGLRAEPARTALPGTVNYVEGQASIDGKALNVKQNGDTRLEPGQTLSTQNGNVEVLLSPGVFVRTGNNSEIRMTSEKLIDPAIEVVHGEVMVEVDQKLKDAQVDVLEHGATASILKQGLYRFDGDQDLVAVIDGKIRVTENGKKKEFGKGKEVTVNGEPLKTVSFNRKAKDDLYRWSSVRSDYLAEANGSTAADIYWGYDPYWGSGWYWNPYYSAWSWLPGDGFFYSPFGYPFFSPGYVIYAPYRFWPGGHLAGRLPHRGPMHVGRPGFGNRGFATRGFANHGFANRGFAGRGFGGGHAFGGVRGGGGRR